MNNVMKTTPEKMRRKLAADYIRRQRKRGISNISLRLTIITLRLYNNRGKYG